MFEAIKKLISGGKPKPEASRQMIETCPDCEVRDGKLHDLFCTKERCPFCGGQLITCNCIETVLMLNDEDKLILEEYVDDSVPPLSDIMERWKEALDRKGRVPFEAIPDDPIRAAYRGDTAAVRRFLDDGFPPDAGNEVGYTAIMGAARGSKFEVIRLLLSRGANAGLPDKRGYTALHWVVAQPTCDAAMEVACLKALLDAGANPNAAAEEGGTPLMNAAWFGCHESVKELLRRGAVTTTKDVKGRSARDLATERGHHDIAKLLE